MKLQPTLVAFVAHRAFRVAVSRPHDFAVTGDEGDYLRRWFLTLWSRYARGTPPANLWQALKRKLPNIYVHLFLRSDDDRALHDHPWWNLSLLIHGSYIEHTIAAGGINHRQEYSAGHTKLRPPGAAHRIEIQSPCWTIFITGPSIREWGFHCPQGWRHWKEFVDRRDSGKIGRGCS
jgi:hypothetical protein